MTLQGALLIRIRKTPHLDPRRGNAVVIELARQTVLGDLLQNADEARDQILKSTRIHLRHVVQNCQGSSHNRGILVTQGSAQFVVERENRLGIQLVKSLQAHDCLFADNFSFVFQQIHDEREDLRIFAVGR